MNFFSRFFSKSVDDILSQFNTMITQLEAAEYNANENAQFFKKVADAAMMKRLEASEEANRAANVRAKVESLVE